MMAINDRGYEVVRRKGVNYYVHRLVAAQMLGRELRVGEQVHHRNGDKLDNRPANLEVLTALEHAQRHRRTHCRRGHDLSIPENVYRRPGDGTTCCRACSLARDRARYARQRRAA